ncbi:MAG: hypothetical protein M3N53_05975 [Actinomycetota bacterium]|nr:hypothetical protein [Actinomycetota bacterium]
MWRRRQRRHLCRAWRDRSYVRRSRQGQVPRRPRSGHRLVRAFRQRHIRRSGPEPRPRRRQRPHLEQRRVGAGIFLRRRPSRRRIR